MLALRAVYTDVNMPDYKDKEQLEALRHKLYDRGRDDAFVSARHSLQKATPIDVARGWASVPPIASVKSTPAVVPAALELKGIEAVSDPVPKSSLRRRYRQIVMLASVAIFVAIVGISSVYLFFGGNQISGKNIDFTLTGPVAVAGGDVLELQVAITNNNAVAIEAATLIVSYPAGTKSVEESPRELFQERINIDDIAPGETRDIIVKSAIFGEENAAREIAATLEYRVKGSNSIFDKKAEPFTFTINSSSIVLRVDVVEKISSGQEFDVKVTLQSNSPTPLKNVLLSAEYPENFTFIRATPDPVYRKNEWVIEDLSAKGTYSVTIRGVASGVVTDAFQLKFQAGTPRTDNQFVVGSVLAQSISTITVERPFVDMKISVGGDSDGDVVLSSGSDAEVVVTVVNTHTDPIYDMTLRVSPTGTAFDESRLRISNGFYDSINKEIRWEASGFEALEKVLPGESREFSFKVSGDKDVPTAILDIEANVFARRVSEDRVAEELLGTSVGVLRFASLATLEGEISHGSSIFSDSGPIPPVANRKTTYTVTLAATAGANDLTGAQVTTRLPQYVEWLNISTEGIVEYNPVSKEVRWSVGAMKGKERKDVSFQVALTPGILQVGSTPVIMNQQEFKATDRFTGTPLSTTARPITTELSSEAGYESSSGIVVGE